MLIRRRLALLPHQGAAERLVTRRRVACRRGCLVVRVGGQDGAGVVSGVVGARAVARAEDPVHGVHRHSRRRPVLVLVVVVRVAGAQRLHLGLFASALDVVQVVFQRVLDRLPADGQSRPKDRSFCKN